MNFFNFLFIILLGGALFSSCTSDVEVTPPETEAQLTISFLMDENADRLDNLGNPVSVPPGNAGQHPDFETLGLHFIGLYPDQFTAYDEGVTVFSSPTTEEGGVAAIDFDEELFLTESDNSISIPLSEVSPGTYNYFRSSIGFQQYTVVYNLEGAANNPDWPDGLDDNIDVDGHVASFLGYNTYINSYTIENESVTVNGNKVQGYFGLESTGEVQGVEITEVTEGDAPQTTVPNPISGTSPVPPGSCVVTGRFPNALVIPENATEDIHVQVTISINNSFEWEDGNGNGKYEPLLNEKVVDMGTRGVFPEVL